MHGKLYIPECRTIRCLPKKTLSRSLSEPYSKRSFKHRGKRGKRGSRGRKGKKGTDGVIGVDGAPGQAGVSGHLEYFYSACEPGGSSINQGDNIALSTDVTTLGFSNDGTGSITTTAGPGYYEVICGVLPSSNEVTTPVQFALYVNGTPQLNRLLTANQNNLPYMTGMATTSQLIRITTNTANFRVVNTDTSTNQVRLAGTVTDLGPRGIGAFILIKKVTSL